MFTGITLPPLISVAAPAAGSAVAWLGSRGDATKGVNDGNDRLPKIEEFAFGELGLEEKLYAKESEGLRKVFGEVYN
jgi:hypothetical protein